MSRSILRKGGLTIKERQIWHSVDARPWRIESAPIDQWLRLWTVDAEPYKYTYGFGFAVYPAFALTVPHWFVILITVMIGILLWVKRPYRFSLRTMLIATTLVAFALGLFAWSRS